MNRKDTKLIEKLGNTCAVARKLGIHRSTVACWKQRGISKMGRKLIEANYGLLAKG